MTTALHEIAFRGEVLERGFWLYVWEITPPQGAPLLYVGRTGDHASGVAQSPFNRFSNHLGGNKHSNALKRHLAAREVRAEACAFRFLPYGPLSVPCDTEHRAACDTMQALEKALADALRAAGYDVVNTVHCRKALDAALWQQVRTAFAQHFPALG